MSVPVIVGLLALLLVVVLAVTMRGAGRATGAGRQSAVIVVLLVGVAGLVLYAVFGR